MKLNNWPEWPEFENGADNSADESFINAKAEIVSQYGEGPIRQAWLRVCKDLETVTESLIALGTDSIPIYTMDQLHDRGLPDFKMDLIRTRGCCIIRGVIPEDEASALFEDLEAFISDNKETITGWPSGTKSLFNLYNSPTQLALRTHPNQLKAQKLLNSLYRDDTGRMNAEPLSYSDALRIRQPEEPFLTLGPHIDAGSLCRWAEPTYRKVYDAIFSGHPEDHDVFDLTIRQDADQFLFKANAHSVIFRSFQGWTALTSTRPGEGTLLLYPDVKHVISYMLLRPFFSPPEKKEDVMDASKWSFDPASPGFPGTFKDRSQHLSPTSHPHLRLKECMTYIPEMNPGDTVWWHTDMCHAVDPEHHGDHAASAAYIAACPTTGINKAYIKKQLQAALAGIGPPDCPDVITNETVMKGYRGFDVVSEDGKVALGFGLL